MGVGCAFYSRSDHAFGNPNIYNHKTVMYREKGAYKW